MILDLTPGVAKTSQYNAFKFPGGEIHVKLNMEELIQLTSKDIRTDIVIRFRFNSSDDFILLLLVIDTLRKDSLGNSIAVEIPYMAYQQADRDFGLGECFSLKTICTILKNCGVPTFTVYDAHSDVAPALLGAKVVDNTGFIEKVMEDLRQKSPKLEETLVVLSPDAGAYKKIGKLMAKLNWKGDIAAANKYRSLSTGNIESLELSVQDFNGKDVLIIDDICMGGNTFIGLAEKLKEKNVGRIYLAVSHMISDAPNVKLWNHFKKVYTTNSRHENYNLPIHGSGDDSVEVYPLYVHKLF